MKLLIRSLVVLLISTWLCCSLRPVRAQGSAARVLDAVLQDYAYQAFARPRTGIVYEGIVPSNLTGISVSAMRLRSGSLRTRGVQMYKEFEIPTGVLVQPYVERLVLVYQNLGNWSMVYYPLPGYMYLAPVLALLPYDAADLMAKNLPVLDIMASGQPISINFSEMRSVPDGLVPKCVAFDLNGSVNFSNVLSGNICTTFRQGHFSVVVESTAPSPAPSPGPMPPAPVAPVPPAAPPKRAPTSGKGNKSNSKVWITVVSVVGGAALLVLLGLLVLWAHKLKKKKQMHQMERAADAGEALHMANVGSTKAPSATVTRTQPTLETEYVP